MYGLILAATMLGQCGPQGCPRPTTVTQYTPRPQYVTAAPAPVQQQCSKPRRGLFAFLKRKR
jgi:hypothetical protein